MCVCVCVWVCVEREEDIRELWVRDTRLGLPKASKPSVGVGCTVAARGEGEAADGLLQLRLTLHTPLLAILALQHEPLHRRRLSSQLVLPRRHALQQPKVVRAAHAHTQQLMQQLPLLDALHTVAVYMNTTQHPTTGDVVSNAPDDDDVCNAANERQRDTRGEQGGRW